jgi:PAS domain S-box-containing protein
MANMVSWLLDRATFTPHGFCLLWDPVLVNVEAASDAVIALAYFSIPLALIAFVVRRRDLAFPWIFGLFGAFILLCGSTHVLEAVTFWLPMYNLEATLKVLTAIASLGTAVALWPLMPQALALPSVGRLRALNGALEQQIVERQRVEQTVRELNDELETRVAERTRELVAVADRLQAEITGRAQAYAALQASEERLRRLIEASPNAAVVVDDAGQVHMVNAAAEHEFGYGRDLMLGRSVLMLIPERMRDRCSRINFWTGQAWPADDRGNAFGRRNDGAEFPIEVALSPFDTAEGGMVLCILTDITERRRQIEMASYLAAIVRSSSDAIISKSLAGIITTWNRAAEAMFGYGEMEIVGAHISTIFPPDRLNEEVFILDRIRQGDTIEQYETVRRRKNGEDFPVVLTVSPIRSPSGEIIGVSKIVRDVTQRKRVDDMLRATNDMLEATFEGAPFPLLVIDGDLSVVRWNRATERTFGYADQEVLGRSIADIFPPPASDGLLALCRGAAPSHVLEAQLPRQDGRPIDVRFSGTPIFRADGTLHATVAAMEDVTQRNMIDAQLRQAQKMEAIGNLTGGMAHDFNNLLGIIIGNLDMLQDMKRGDAEVAELAGEALAAAERGADLTRGLLAFARRQPLQPETFDLAELIDTAVKLLRRLLDENVEIITDYVGERCSVTADPTQLVVALTNLATNARDAMPAGGKLRIGIDRLSFDEDYARSHPEVRAGDYAAITVSDTGSGIPAEVLGQIFEPFYTTKERDKGSGLGLSMVFGYVKQSGGHVTVESRVGLGTTFKLYLPLAHGPMKPVEATSGSEQLQGHDEMVLAVEDNAALRRTLVRQLASLGYRVLEAANGAEAIGILEQAMIDLVFSDVVMPGEIDGFSLAQTIRQRWPHVHVVLASGFPETKLREAHPTIQARLLNKPYRKEQLARVLREVLDGRRHIPAN